MYALEMEMRGGAGHVLERSCRMKAIMSWL